LERLYSPALRPQTSLSRLQPGRRTLPLRRTPGLRPPRSCQTPARQTFPSPLMPGRPRSLSRRTPVRHRRILARRRHRPGL